MTVTRADLESRRFQKLIAELDLDLPILSETELANSVKQMLESQSGGDSIWVFAYGSLIWNPLFNFDDRRLGTIYGWHRKFCHWTPVGRGTPHQPGLVLGLDRGGCCQGVAFQLPAQNAAQELLLLWRREMIVGSYCPRWVNVWDGANTIQAIAFTMNRQHPLYAPNLTREATLATLATASGTIGSCADYLLQTVEGLASMGIRDRPLLLLRNHLLERQGVAHTSS